MKVLHTNNSILNLSVLFLHVCMQLAFIHVLDGGHD